MGLTDEEDLQALAQRTWCASIPAADLYKNCVVYSVTDTRWKKIGPGEAEVTTEEDPLSGASIVLSPHEHGAPAPHARRGTTGKDGSVSFGPLAGEEWWADVSAPGHAPIRILITNLSDRDCEIYLFPSRTRQGRIRLDGKTPPPGTTAQMGVEVLPGWPSAGPMFYRVNEDGTFVVEEPIRGRFSYTLRFPDERVAQFWVKDGSLGRRDRDENDITLTMTDVE